MKKLSILLAFWLLTANVEATEKKVELVANFSVDVESLNREMAEQDLDVKIVLSDLKRYKKAIRQKTTRWSKILQKIPRGFWITFPLEADTSKIVFWNLTNHYFHKTDLGRLPKEKLVLFMWEPPTVLPNMYSKRVRSWFSKIYTWNDDLVDNQTYFKVYYSVLQPMLDHLPSFEEKKLCTLISSDLSSNHPNELYSERKKAIRFFESQGEEGFEFYGRRWDASAYTNYRGSVAPEDKLKVLKNYRFSVCYENIRDYPGYVTEKIFDCFAAGNVPIYWGASNIEKYVPKDCFIDRRDFATLDELYVFIKEMKKEQYEGYIERIKVYLASDQAQLFSRENFKKILAESLLD